jgi:hypothetical protein
MLGMLEIDGVPPVTPSPVLEPWTTRSTVKVELAAGAALMIDAIA